VITKNKLWNIIVLEMKTKKRLDDLTAAVMKKIEDLGSKDRRES